MLLFPPLGTQGWEKLGGEGFFSSSRGGTDPGWHYVNVEQYFQFSEITSEEVLSKINNLDSKNIGSCKNIPTKILKESSEISSEHLAKIWNEQVISKNFPKELKLADTTPIFKEEDSMQAKNYRPLCVLHCVSKVFERMTQKQLSEYIEKNLSPFLCGYRKGFNTQTALLELVEK